MASGSCSVPGSSVRRLVGGRSPAENFIGADDNLIALVARTRQWFDRIAKGEVTSVREIARQEDIDEGDVSRFLPLAFLAPDTVQAILAGKQPPELTAERLKRLRFLPHGWQEQRESLGFHS